MVVFRLTYDHNNKLMCYHFVELLEPVDFGLQHLSLSSINDSDSFLPLSYYSTYFVLCNHLSFSYYITPVFGHRHAPEFH